MNCELCGLDRVVFDHSDCNETRMLAALERLGSSLSIVRERAFAEFIACQRG